MQKTWALGLVVVAAIAVSAILVATTLRQAPHSAPPPAVVSSEPPTPSAVATSEDPSAPPDTASRGDSPAEGAFGSALSEPPPTASSDDDTEERFWQSIDGAGEPELFERYLAIFPNGRYRDRAQARLRELGLTEGAAMGPTPVGGDGDGPRLPDFPWPPPEPSALLVLPDVMFRDATGDTTLDAVANRLIVALQRSHYEYSFYRAPGGFALVARLERIADDGSPVADDRRFLPPDAEEPFNFIDYISQLFFAPAGYYRMIVFVVTDLPFRGNRRAADGRRHRTPS
jgi:hypothetical protein